MLVRYKTLITHFPRHRAVPFPVRNIIKSEGRVSVIMNLAFTTFSWCYVILSHRAEDNEKFLLT